MILYKNCALFKFLSVKNTFITLNATPSEKKVIVITFAHYNIFKF